MTEGKLRIVDILDILKLKLAYIPGGRDREGKPILIVNLPLQLPDKLGTKLEKLLHYLLSIFNDSTKLNGICLIVDARKGVWREAKSYIKSIINVVGKYTVRSIVIRHDTFWEKRMDNCTKSANKYGELIYVPITQLNLYVDVTQITNDFGGIKNYDENEWIEAHLKVEEYETNATDLINKLTDLEDKLKDYEKIVNKKEQEKAAEYYWEMRENLESVSRFILHSGRILASSMSIQNSQDYQDTVNKIHDYLDIIESKQVEVEHVWNRITANFDLVKEIHDLEIGVSEVTNWILMSGNAMLNFHCNVGFDVISSENLRREHEELELECRDTYGKYAKILHQIECMPEHYLTEDLKSQKDFMNFVCRSFATRLERRRNVLITCQRFFRLVSEYFDRTSDVFDKLVIDNRNGDFSQAEQKLNSLEANQSDLERLLKEIIKEGEKLSDILSMPIKDALGRDLDITYEEDIANIRDILDATNARKNIFNDSVELQKITLQQITLIECYETDAKQSIEWLTNLFYVLIEKHRDIGCNANEIQAQRMELQVFQETAKGTYDYGCQLLNGARILRSSCRLNSDDNTRLFFQLRQAWRQLCLVVQEQRTRQSVCTVFHKNIDEHCIKLNDLINTAKNLSSPHSKLIDVSLQIQSSYSTELLETREKLLLNVGRTVRLGKLLRTRLKYPQLRMFRFEEESNSLSKTINLSAIDAISERLVEVARLAEKLDAKLYEAETRTRLSKDCNENTEEIDKHKKYNVPLKSISHTLLKSEITEPSSDNKNFITEESNSKLNEVPLESQEINEKTFVTATETPVIKSSTRSLIPTTECGHVNPILSLSRVEEIEKPEENRIIETLISCVSSNDTVHAPSSVNKSSDVIIDLNQNIDVKTNTTAFIESVEEKNEKIRKEVTEVITLKVSQDFKLGLTSYKLTSNTLTESSEIKNTNGILDANHKTFNQCHNDEAANKLKCYSEEITVSSVNS